MISTPLHGFDPNKVKASEVMVSHRYIEDVTLVKKIYEIGATLMTWSL